MIADKIACSEQFCEDNEWLTLDLWDFIRKMQSWAILAVACHMSHPSDSL